MRILASLATVEVGTVEGNGLDILGVVFVGSLIIICLVAGDRSGKIETGEDESVVRIPSTLPGIFEEVELFEDTGDPLTSELDPDPLDSSGLLVGASSSFGSSSIADGNTAKLKF